MSSKRDDHEDGDDELLRGLRSLRDVTPPPSLVPAVMQRVSDHAPGGFWTWLHRPRRVELRVSPLGLFGGVLATALAVIASPLLLKAPRGGVAMTGAGGAADARPGVTPTAEEGVVLVRFVLLAKGARRVAVAGDFNGWSPAETVLENRDGRGTFVATVPLPRGAHEYMFVVDGEWITDPAAAEVRPDGFGRSNAVLRL